MDLSSKRYTIGEVSKATGLTIRALQHYDNIGLLPASGRTEGGRRYYTAKDMLQLEQIVFYKSIGIPLCEIRISTTGVPPLSDVEATLKAHHALLMKQADALHMAMSVIAASLDVVQSGHYPPWDMLTQLIRTVDGSSVIDWADFSFDASIHARLAESGMNNMQGALEFYHHIRELMVEAATLKEANESPQSEQAVALAKRWWELIMTITGGDATLVQSMVDVQNAKDTWPAADRALFDIAEPFMEAALDHFLSKNNIDIPNALRDN